MPFKDFFKDTAGKATLAAVKEAAQEIAANANKKMDQALQTAEQLGAMGVIALADAAGKAEQKLGLAVEKAVIRVVEVLDEIDTALTKEFGAAAQQKAPAEQPQPQPAAEAAAKPAAQTEKPAAKAKKTPAKAEKQASDKPAAQKPAKITAKKRVRKPKTQPKA